MVVPLSFFFLVRGHPEDFQLTLETLSVGIDFSPPPASTSSLLYDWDLLVWAFDRFGRCSQEGDQQANGVEQRWQEAAAALGPAERQVKFLRLLGAKKGAAATAAAAGASTASSPRAGNPFSPSGAGGAGADDGRAANAKVFLSCVQQYFECVGRVEVLYFEMCFSVGRSL